MIKMCIGILFLIGFGQSFTGKGYRYSVAGDEAKNYELLRDVFDAGGTNDSTSSYLLKGSLGQPTIGIVYNISDTAYIGFFTPESLINGIKERRHFWKTDKKGFQPFLAIYPNPSFFPISIRYGIGEEGPVSLKVYNVNGECVKTLIDRYMRRGTYKILLSNKEKFPSGIYFIKMKTPFYTETKKIILFR